MCTAWRIFGRKRAEGYPGKGMAGRPEPLRRAEVSTGLCAGCGDCRSVCRYGKIKIRNGTALVSRGCRGCGTCVSACSTGAVTMIDLR